ncbi:protein S100-P-like [Poecilia formosa]|nr:PREDICTED: protein S100-P-like [Poecilia formosa]
MSKLLGAIGILKQTFDEYAGTDGDKTTLSKKEIAAMLKKELPGAGGDKKEEVDQFFKMLDEDGDGVVNFNEYIIFVATLALLLTGGKV